MADFQKIHPVNMENTSPKEPLAPRGSLASEKGDPAAGPYPPFRRTFPVSHSRPPKRRSCCCKCLCWTISLLLLLVILIGATGGILYLVFRPKLPEYSVDRLRITDFRLNPLNNSLYAQFGVRFTAENPNKKIGIYYEDGSYLSVWFDETLLCDGSWPVFYQGHRNTTVFEVLLSGENQVGGTLQAALQAQQQTGQIPLDFKGEVPVKIKFGRLKLRKVRFLVNCKMVVNSLAVSNQITLKTNSCKFKLKL